MVNDTTLEPSDRDAKVFSARALITLAEAGIAATAIIAEVDPLLSDNTRMLAILTLWLRGPKRPSELATALGLTTGGSTKIVNKLEKAGLVSKAPDIHDGRAIVVSLTPRGRQTVEHVTERLVPVMERVVTRLGAFHTLAE